MKNLSNYIKESLREINESFKNLKVYTPNWRETPTICREYPTIDPFSTMYPSNSSKKFNIKKTDWIYGDLGDFGNGNIAEIQWCDDQIYGFVSKAKNINQVKNEFIKVANKWIEDNHDYFIDDEFPEFYFELPSGFEFDYAYDKDVHGSDIPSAIDLWGLWMQQLNNSEVDGDSTYAHSLIDLSQKKVIAGHEVIFDL